jgi:hypothetical protein
MTGQEVAHNHAKCGRTAKSGGRLNSSEGPWDLGQLFGVSGLENPLDQLSIRSALVLHDVESSIIVGAVHDPVPVYKNVGGTEHSRAVGPGVHQT